MRTRLPALFTGLLATLLATPCPAQEPLFLRIRPHDAPRPEGIGAGPSAEEVAAARAARDAVWERADRRARLAIASVCTGCLPPAAPKAQSETRTVANDVPSGTEEGAAPPTGAALLALTPSRQQVIP